MCMVAECSGYVALMAAMNVLGDLQCTMNNDLHDEGDPTSTDQVNVLKLTQLHRNYKFVKTVRA